MTYLKLVDATEKSSSSLVSVFLTIRNRMIRHIPTYVLHVNIEHKQSSAKMETQKKNKHVEVQFISDRDVGREIISSTDTKIKKIGNNVNTNFSHVNTLILNSADMVCKRWLFNNQETECSYSNLSRHKALICVWKSHRRRFSSLTQKILK
jgi:hypothetical protein